MECRWAMSVLNRRQWRERRWSRSSVFSVTACWFGCPCRIARSAPVLRTCGGWTDFFRVFHGLSGYMGRAAAKPEFSLFSETFRSQLLSDGFLIAENL